MSSAKGLAAAVRRLFGGFASEPLQVDDAEKAAERWEEVQSLFESALELPSDARSAFIDDASVSDDVVRAEVHSLLVAHENTGPLESLGERLALGTPRRGVGELEGQMVHHYEVVEKVGDGGMGVLYKARDIRLDRIVALKFLSPHFLADRDAKNRFRIEAQAAASLDHPNLCTVHEVGETEDGLLFMAMAYYDGESLRRRIRRGALAADEALAIAAQVCRGLARAAEQGVIHRDIKPANIMFAGDGTVKIVDFGLAKVRDGELTRSGELMGTVAYMSPEQTRGEPVDARTDIWSLGVVLYEMLAGVRPFQKSNDQAVIHAILSMEPPRLDELVPGLSPGVVGVVERMLEKEAAHRYPDAARLLTDLEDLIEDPSSPAVAAMKPRLATGGERRLVTVLAGTIGGFDDVLESTGETAVSEELTRLRTWIEETVEAYGGAVHEFSEHGFASLFGVPVAHEDDALRAVRAARELLEKLGAPGTVHESFRLSFGVGSEVVPVSRSDLAHRRYRIGGTVVRDTALVAASGAAGDVLVAPGSARGVAPFLVTEERTPVTISADRPSIVPLAVVAESEVDSRLDASLSRGLSPFVGRAREMSTLAEALGRARAGHGTVLSIVGDAGVGKSRVLHEFRAALAEEGVRYLQGRCRSHGRLAPYAPFIECARTALGIGRQAPVEGVDFAARAKSLDPHLEAYAPVLAHLIAPDGQDRVLGAFSAEEKAAAAVEVLSALFTLGSRGQLVVLMLEDWHWADDGSMVVLEQLAAMVPTHPVLVVVTSRSPVTVGHEGGHEHARIDLRPLDVSGTESLARVALGRVKLDERLLEHIEARTGGNPFFIEELCEHLVENESLNIDGGVASFAGDPDSVTVPATVQAVLKTRLDRLDPESREVLRSASVIGREFGLSLLSRVVPSPSRLEGVLRVLRSSGLVQPTAVIPEPRYRFKHALTLDVAYSSLLERQRRERHALVGEAIEELVGAELDEWLEDLTRHFAEARDWQRAVEYGMAAAAKAGRLWRWSEAVSLLEKVEEWLGRREGKDDSDKTLLVDLLLARETYLERLGRRSEQDEVIRRLESLVSHEPSRARAAVLARRIGILTQSSMPVETEAALAELTEVAEACGAYEERAHALRAMATWLRRSGRHDEAVEPILQVLEYSRDRESPDVVLRDLYALGMVHRWRGDVDAALEVAEELRVWEGRTSSLEAGMVAHFMGEVRRLQGRREEALEAFEVAGQRHDEVGLTELAPVRKSMHLVAVAAVQVELGRLEDGLATYEYAVELARRGGASHTARALLIHADLLAGLGRVVDALGMYREAVEILEADASLGALPEVSERYAEALESLGDDEAIPAWDRVRRIREELEDWDEAAAATEREARLHRPESRRRRELLEQAIDLARRVEDPRPEARVRNSLALAAWRAGDLELACEHFEAAARGLSGTDEKRQLGIILNGWGVVLSKAGEASEAEDLLVRALEVNRAAGSLTGQADSHSALGALFSGAKDRERAGHEYTKCLELRRACGDRVGEGWALHRLADLHRLDGAGSMAAALDADALSIAREVGDGALIVLCEEATKPTKVNTLSEGEENAAVHH